MSARFNIKCSTLLLAVLLLNGVWMFRVTASADTSQSGAGARPAETPANRADTEGEQRLYRLASERGMFEAARANGGHFASVMDLQQTFRGRAQTLEEIIRSTGTIVVGVLDRGTPRLNTRGDTVQTVYPLDITESVRGNATGRVQVQVPGGRLVAPDGAVAETLTPGFALKPGDTYLLCLRPSSEPGEADHVLMLGIGPQGVIDLSAGAVKMSPPLPDPLRNQYEHRPAAAFLREVRELAKAADAQAR
jgi:hypothetical protein